MKRIVALGDTHVKHQDQKLIDAICLYLEETHVDHLVHVGDFLDLETISRFVKNKPRLIEGRRLDDEFAAGRKVLRQIVRATRNANPACDVSLLEGNHEHRLNDLIDRSPELEGLFNVRKDLDLDALGVDWVPYWSEGKTVTVGPLTFAHGDTACKYHANNMAMRHMVPMIAYGHTHDTQRHPLPRSGKSPLIAQSLGCTCDTNPPYMRGKPSKWQQAFGIFYLWDDGTYQDAIININGGKFIAEGYEYVL